MAEIKAASHVNDALTPIIGRDLAGVVAGYMRSLPKALKRDIEAWKDEPSNYFVQFQLDRLTPRLITLLVEHYVKGLRPWMKVHVPLLKQKLKEVAQEWLLMDDGVTLEDIAASCEEDRKWPCVTYERVWEMIENQVEGRSESVVSDIDKLLDCD